MGNEKRFLKKQQFKNAKNILCLDNQVSLYWLDYKI